MSAFYSEALAAVEAEMHWLASVLPEQAAGLATGLMAALFARTDKSFRMRISATLVQGYRSQCSVHCCWLLVLLAIAGMCCASCMAVREELVCHLQVLRKHLRQWQC